MTFSAFILQELFHLRNRRLPRIGDASVYSLHLFSVCFVLCSVYNNIHTTNKWQLFGRHLRVKTLVKICIASALTQQNFSIAVVDVEQ